MENKKPLVSVIMNCYNSDKYLREAIDSVIAQTYQNWEIIFWDNQSTDSSAEIVKSYDDKRIHYFYAPNHTPLGEARNLAVKKAAGEWIGILDCDDIWHENKLEVQLESASDEIGMIYSRVEFLLEDSGRSSVMGKSIKKTYYPKLDELPSGDVFDKLLYECFIPLPSVVMRRNLFEKVGGIDSSLKVAEDYDIFLKIAKISGTLAIDDVLCKYRVHGGNLSHENIDVTFSESIALVNSYSNYMQVSSHRMYWKLKYGKNLIRQGRFLKLFLTALTINPIVFLKYLLKK
ncbi:MAG: hypothetical protein C0602_10450 [Denitrovibrio sp.]|nr:MAG: hypothetical protein C0602_10450 [Denitrovibrio sp.]